METDRLTDDQRALWSAYGRALAVLLSEYPEDAGLLEMLDIVKIDGIRFIREFSYKARAARANGIGVPMSGVDLIETKMHGRVASVSPYINKQGYSHLLQKDERKIKTVRVWTKVYPFLVTSPENSDKVVGASEDGTCVAVCYLEFQSGENYEDEGTASERSAGRVKERLIEMAHTRAFNRTVGIATGKGLVSAEEMSARLEPIVKAPDPATTGARERAKAELAKLAPAKQIELLVAIAKTVDPDTLSIEDADRVCKAVAEKTPKGETNGKGKGRKTSKGKGRTEGKKNATPAGSHQLQPDHDGSLPLPVSDNAVAGGAPRRDGADADRKAGPRRD